MFQLPLGSILLTILFALIYFGAARRVLDRMHMRDRTALILIALMIAGSFWDIPISERIILNAGGSITIGVAVYLWVTSGTAKEKIRSLAAAVLTSVVLYFSGQFLESSPEAVWIDPIYLYPLIAGAAGYLAGRSRRGAFFSAVMGVLSMDITQYIYFRYYGIQQEVYIGGAGMFDSMVTAGILAVLLADFIGETRESLQGGPSEDDKPKELLENLKPPHTRSEVFRKPVVKPVPAEEYQKQENQQHLQENPALSAMHGKNSPEGE